MLIFLDWLFLAFHSALTLFNLSGWFWKKTRRIHLAVISLTFASWIGLGFFYGFGYCPLTDWHWRVKYRLGQTDLPASYVKYYLDRVTGMDWSPATVDVLVLVLGLLALFLSIALNWRDAARDRKRRRGARSADGP